jgi:hypothetical protein
MANPTKSGWYTNTLLAALLATAQTGTGGLNYSLATWKVSLLTYATSTDGASPIQFQTTTQAWVNTFEATGTGWATGGVVLNVAASGSTSVVPTVTLGGASPYYIQYSWTNPLSVAGTTLTGVGGMIIYADPLSAPIVKPMVLYINFGSAYSTVAGTFGVTPSGSGLSQITLTQ